MFPLIVATGPLTSDALSADIAALVGGDHLYFYDAISPIVLAETIDMTKVFRASRWDRSLGGRRGPRAGDTAPTQSDPRFGRDRPACGVDDGEGDYLNCPLTRDEYERFYDALVDAESATVHDFDKERFFEGCLPIEVMAHRGRDTLRFGPMKPVGLVDPRTGREPYAAVQLRQDNLAGDHFSLVGFQTQIKWGEQARVLRLIPGLEQAEFVRFGMVHRNTYINGPTVLARDVADADARRRCSSPGRCRASRATSSRRRRASSPASTPRRCPRRGAARRRRGRRRSARWRTTCRTPTRALPAVEHHLRHHGASRLTRGERRAARRKKTASRTGARGSRAGLAGCAGVPLPCEPRESTATQSRSAFLEFLRA